MPGAFPTFCTEAVPPRARASALRGAVERAFPGMRVLDIDREARARLRGAPLASGAIFELETNRKEVCWSPPGRSRPALFVLLVVRGECHVAQAGREARLISKTFAFIDGAHPFQLSVSDASAHALVELPRGPVRACAKIGDSALARASSSTEAGDLHLARTLQSLAGAARSMSPCERSIAEHSLLSLLSLASVLRVEAPTRSHWLERAHAALDVHAIEAGFDASALAETLGVSRRHLDGLFSRTGTTVSREIWERRLRRAALDLCSLRDARRTVLDIALSVGFSDAAHFSRAFRRRFGCPPSEWRSQRLVPRI